MFFTSKPVPNISPSLKMDLDFWDCNPKYLDLSLKMDLDFWDGFGRNNVSYN